MTSKKKTTCECWNLLPVVVAGWAGAGLAVDRHAQAVPGGQDELLGAEVQPDDNHGGHCES